MLRFLFGVGVGIYVAQVYPDKIPPIKPIVDGLTYEANRRLQEYNKSVASTSNSAVDDPTKKK